MSTENLARGSNGKKKEKIHSHPHNEAEIRVDFLIITATIFELGIFVRYSTGRGVS